MSVLKIGSVCLGLALSCFTCGIAQANTIYNFINRPSLQFGNGTWDLSGSIVTDGSTGSFDLATTPHILSWQFTATQTSNNSNFPPSWGASSSSGGVVSGTVTITATEIISAPMTTVDFTSSSGLINYGYSSPGYYYSGNFPSDTAWFAGFFNATQLGQDGWIIATAVPVPEPSSMALLGVGAMALVGYSWRKQQSK